MTKRYTSLAECYSVPLDVYGAAIVIALIAYPGANEFRRRDRAIAGAFAFLAREWKRKFYGDIPAGLVQARKEMKASAAETVVLGVFDRMELRRRSSLMFQDIWLLGRTPSEAAGTSGAVNAVLEFSTDTGALSEMRVEPGDPKCYEPADAERGDVLKRVWRPSLPVLHLWQAWERVYLRDAWKKAGKRPYFSDIILESKQWLEPVLLEAERERVLIAETGCYENAKRRAFPIVLRPAPAGAEMKQLPYPGLERA